jgi:hypothetical protein
MLILPEVNGSRNEELNTTGPASNKNQETSKSVKSEQTKRTDTSHQAPVPETPTSVTLNRDAEGKFFYRVTNSQTGELIMEFPPEAVRAVGKGIEEYVQEHARSTKKLEAKA